MRGRWPLDGNHELKPRRLKISTSMQVDWRVIHQRDLGSVAKVAGSCPYGACRPTLRKVAGKILNGRAEWREEKGGGRGVKGKGRNEHANKEARYLYAYAR